MAVGYPSNLAALRSLLGIVQNIVVVVIVMGVQIKKTTQIEKRGWRV